MNRLAVTNLFGIQGLNIAWYGIIIASGLLLGIWLGNARARKRGWSSDLLLDFILLAVPLAVIGASTYYVAFEWDYFAAYPERIIAINQGGLAIYGAVIGGFLAAFFFSRAAKFPFLKLIDLLIPSLILGQAIGRWGNLINQEAYGALITNPGLQFFPLAVYIEAIGEWHQATFFYESVCNAILFVVTLLLGRKNAKDGTLLAVDCDAIVDSGAYSAYPFSACLEAAQVASILPGPYKMAGYRCHTRSIASNKPPILPYRGVARAGTCFAIEIIMGALAHELGMEPSEMRRRNLATPEEMPFVNITNKIFDSGDYPECLRRAEALIDLPAIRARQQKPEKDGRRIGVGFAIFCEQAAHGTSVYSGWGIPMVPGLEQATARLTPDGGLELRVGVQSHGQSLETTLAQIANQMIGIAPSAVKVVHGDTALTPYSTGTWGSRCIVMAGGAVASACEILGTRIRTIAAHLLQTSPDMITLADGFARGPAGQVSLKQIGEVWYLRPQDLPANVNPGGLEVTQGYRTVRDTGTFSYACHAALVAVDINLGDVEILDYRIVEDGGVLINPMVVDGQVCGGTAQGIGTALYEEMAFDANGQPLASTLADYHLPGAAEIPALVIDHMETPSPISFFGQKGIGESGAIGPPAAIANAVNDAIRPLGAEIGELPITPERLLSVLAKAAR